MTSKKPLVSIARNKSIALAVNLCLDQLELPNLTGKTVLLKPNVGRVVDPNLAINTNPKVVSAVFDYLRDRYESNYLIGDSPIINTVVSTISTINNLFALGEIEAVV